MDTKWKSPPNLNQMSGLGLPTPGTTPLLVFEAFPQEATVQELFNKIKGKKETHYSECYMVQMTKSQKLLFEKIQKEFIGNFACISVKKTSSVITGLTIKNCFKTSQTKLPYKICLEINNLCSYNVGSIRNQLVTGLTSYENFIAIFGNCPRFFPKKNHNSDIVSKLEHEPCSTYTPESDKKLTTPKHILSSLAEPALAQPGLVQPPPGFGHHSPGLVQPPPGFGHHSPGLAQPPPGFGHHSPGLAQRQSSFGQPPQNAGYHSTPGFGQPPPNAGYHSTPGFGYQAPPGFGQVVSSYNQQPSPIFGQVSSGYSQQQSGFGPPIEDDDTNLLNMAASSARNRILDQNI
tara:strand:- start:1210 stop:2250 length:1041 start_codon:yes stop_codon:yes gene_type:complete